MRPNSNGDAGGDPRLDLAAAEYLEAVERGLAPDRGVWLRRYSDIAGELNEIFDSFEFVEGVAAPLRAATDFSLGPVTLGGAGCTPDTLVGDVRPTPGGGVDPSFGGYHILEEIGAGGMGVVYRARHVELKRTVALKMIRSGVRATEAEAQRFRNEAMAAAALDHPHIVSVFEAGYEQGQLYYAMRLVEGQSLAADPQRFRGRPREAARILAAVARAVHHAHQRGILHRDLKPSNILLDADGVPHVTDFGLAKRLGSGQSLTVTGAVVGTPGYMAPEQSGGHRGGDSVASDVYGLGALLYALLAGRPPFQGQTILDVLEQTRSREPASLRGTRDGIDRDLDTVCRKCLDKEPACRYRSAEALADDLDRWLERRPIEARPVGRAFRAWRWCRRNPAPAALVVLATLSVVAGVAILAASNQLLIRKQTETDAALVLARQKERSAKLHAYVANIRLARQALDSAPEQEVNELLRQSAPEPGEEDFRGFEWYYLRRRCRERQVALSTLQGHDGAVYAAAFSPGGRLLASVGRDGTLRLWDADSGRPRATRRVAADEVNYVVFSPDGKTLVTVDDAKCVRTWSGPDYCRSEEYARLESPVVAAAFSPDGRTLAVGLRNGELRSWDFASRRRLRDLRAPDATKVETVAFSPDGKQLAAGGGAIDLFEMSSGESRRLSLPHEQGGSTEMAYSHDGRFLAVNAGPRVFLVDRVSGTTFAELRGHTRGIQSLDFSPDDRLLASGSGDGTVRLWDVPSGRGRAVLSPGLWRVWCVTFSPDGTGLAATYSDGSVRRWSLERLRDYSVPEATRSWCGGNPPQFSPRDGRMALTASRGAIRLFSPDLATARDVIAGRGVASRAAFTADGRRLASVSADGTVEIAGLDGGSELSRFRLGCEMTRGHINAVFRADNGGLLVWDSLDDGVRELDPGSGVVRCRPVDDSATKAGGFSPDGRHLVYWRVNERDANENWLTVLDLETGEQHTSEKVGFVGYYTAMAYAPGSGLLAAVTGTRSIRFLDLRTLQPRGLIQAAGAAIRSLAFSPDGKTLASGGEGEVRLWNVELRQELFTLDVGGFAEWVAFLPDGRALIANFRQEGNGARMWQADPAEAAGDRQPE